MEEIAVKENKGFSLSETEEQVELDGLITDDEEPTGELIIENYLAEAEEDPPGELIIERYLDDHEEDFTGKLVFADHDRDAAEQQMGPLEELAGKSEIATEIEQTLRSISDTLDHLINESDQYVRQHQLHDPKKERSRARSNLVPDLYDRREWHLVFDDRDDYEKNKAQYPEYDDSVASSSPKPPADSAANAEPVEKKSSLGSLGTALLAGGGVLVVGLATAGVVTAIKSYRKKSQQSVTLSEEAPTVTQPVEENIVEPPKEEEPPQKQIAHTNLGGMYRAPLPPRAPVIPLFGFPRPNHWEVS